MAATTHSITIRTANARGQPARRSSETNGFRISATSAPMMNSKRTRPAAWSTAHSPRMASGSMTSCTHRGTSTR